MKPFALLVSAVVLFVTGCSSPTAVARRDPYVKPGLIMLTADQAARRGINVAAPASPMEQQCDPGAPPLAASAVVADAGVKVMTLNRAVDPADRELMHEEHVVYRRESSPRWKLDAPAEQKILVGPKVTDGRQDIQPVLTKELTTFLAEQRRATEGNQKAIDALFQAVDALNRNQQSILRREQQNGSPAAARTPERPLPDDAPASVGTENLR